MDTTFHSSSNIPEAFDVVAIGAHPDDVEIACGGTLARLVEQGYRVGIVDLTDGEPTPRSPGPDVRLAEAAQAADVLGVNARITLNLPNRRLFDTFEARIELARVLRRWRPRIVIGFGDKTPLASPDHHQAMLITDAAIFYSRLTKWEEHFPNLPPHTITSQLYFTFAFWSFNLPPGPGHFVVDIGTALAKKLAAVQCYQTQFPTDREPIFERIQVLAHQVGSMAGFDAGELFIATRTLGTRDLVQAVL